MLRAFPKLTLLILAFALAAASVSAQSRRVRPTPTPTPDDTVRVVTEEIKLNVLAFDEEGKFVDGVRAEDLVITESNVLHQPTSVRRSPASVLIVMDTGGELRWVKSLEQTRLVANALVSALKPGDSAALIQYSDKPEIVAEWTTDKAEIRSAIGRTKFGRRSTFVKALELSRDFLAKSGLENKHLVLITDGTDSSANYNDKRRTMRSLLSSDVTVHVMSYGSLEAKDIEPRTKGISKSPPPKAIPDEVAATLPNGARDIATAPKIGPTIILDRKHLQTMRARKTDLEVSEEQLAELAQDSNGEIVIPETKEEMVEKAALVARLIDSSYVVTYTPKEPVEQSGTERTIVVTSKRPGLVVEARRKLVVNNGSR